MQYMVLIQRNVDTQTQDSEWSQFFQRANASGMFKGGSAMSHAGLVGNQKGSNTEAIIGGYMRFDSTDRQSLRALLEEHPVVKNGGTVELYELPKSK